MFFVVLFCLIINGEQECFACDDENRVWYNIGDQMHRLPPANRCARTPQGKEYRLLQENIQRDQEVLQAHRKDREVRRRFYSLRRQALGIDRRIDLRWKKPASATAEYLARYRFCLRYHSGQRCRWLVGK